jgi:hypothetical protein
MEIFFIVMQIIFFMYPAFVLYLSFVVSLTCALWLLFSISEALFTKLTFTVCFFQNSQNNEVKLVAIKNPDNLSRLNYLYYKYVLAMPLQAPTGVCMPPPTNIYCLLFHCTAKLKQKIEMNKKIFSLIFL